MKNTYEIPVYNSKVREMMKNGDSHPGLDDRWAETHFVSVGANTPEEAIEICRRKHPEKKGFVFGKIVEVI